MNWDPGTAGAAGEGGSRVVWFNTTHWLAPATFFIFFIFLNFFKKNLNRNEIIIMHTKNEFFSIKIEKVRQKIDPKSFNSPTPGGLRV